MDFRWSACAYQVAMDAAREGPKERRRWFAQNEWDAEHMRTEATRFTLDLDTELRQCCREAHVTRYTLIAYLLRTWMAAWKVYGEGSETEASGGGGPPGDTARAP